LRKSNFIDTESFVILVDMCIAGWRRLQQRRPKNIYWRRTWRRWRRSGV